MREIQSDFGRVVVGARADLFAEALKLTLAARAAARPGRFLWALTGGSTPASFYQWCAENGGLPPALLQGTDFTVSDERHVLLSSPESNFGNAERQLLEDAIREQLVARMRCEPPLRSRRPRRGSRQTCGSPPHRAPPDGRDRAARRPAPS